ncbi:Cell surface protein [Oopsacas minuta]|uniref:Cell surface protein n=1 Tax=Oopsacas minuta TaxID=111878 RepID=A0AAV7JHP0_9METZ|nr:Cell surface protein [Oopsacas minuta]
MATNKPMIKQLNKMAQFDAVATEIQQTFNLLIAQLIERRDALLHQLSKLQEDYTIKETARKAAIQELEKTRKQMENTSLKFNANIPVHNQATMVYQQGLQDLEAPTKLTYPLFQYSTLQTIQSAISEFGEVLEWEVPDYSLKKVPILITGNRGKGKNEFDAAGLFLDEDNHRIYIADYGNSRVQVMSFEGKFLESFGKGFLKEPYGIAVKKEYIFITDTSHNSLFKFCKNKHEIMNRTWSTSSEEEQLNNPGGICIDTNGDVFVVNRDKHRVSIFSTLLQYKSNLGVKQLHHPQDVKLTQDCVVVLDWSPRCVHLFSRNGDYLSSCISQGQDQNCLLCCPRFFCTDLASNIIISDTGHHSIKILTQSGEFIHSIGKGKGEKRGEFNRPYGIGISKLGLIFVLSFNPTYSLQCF